MSEQEPFVNIEDVATHFSVSVSTIRKWLREGRVPKTTYIKIGNTYRFKLGSVEAALTGASDDSDAPVQLELDLGEKAELPVLGA